MAENIFTDENFKEEVIESKQPVLVDFWAPWCGPCRISNPMIDRITEELKGKPIKIGKMNVDENIVTAQKFGIMSIPTFLIFKGGKVVEQIIGVPSESGLKAKIETYIK